MNCVIQRTDNYLAHHGIKGQKWGVRRFQNPDGTRTPEGMKRYSNGRERSYVGGAYRAKRDTAAIDREQNPRKKKAAMQSMLDDLYSDRQERYEKDMRGERDDRTEKSEYLDEAAAWLMDKITKESGDWYWNEPVSKANKEISKDIDDLTNDIKVEYAIATKQHWYGGYVSEKIRRKNKALDSMLKDLEKLQSDRLGVVLKDIGMDDNPENRTKIEPYVYWD